MSGYRRPGPISGPGDGGRPGAERPEHVHDRRPVRFRTGAARVHAGDTRTPPRSDFAPIISRFTHKTLRTRRFVYGMEEMRVAYFPLTEPRRLLCIPMVY